MHHNAWSKFVGALLLGSLAACGDTKGGSSLNAPPAAPGAAGQVSVHTVVISPGDLLSDVGDSLLTVTIERNGGDVDLDVVDAVRRSLTLVDIDAGGVPVRFESSVRVTRSQAGMAVGSAKGQPAPPLTHPVRGNAVVSVRPLRTLQAGWHMLSVAGASPLVRDLIPVPGRAALSATFAPGSAPVLRSLRACKKGDAPDGRDASWVGYIEFSEGVLNPDHTLVRDAGGAACALVSASDVALDQRPRASTTYKMDGCDVSKGFWLTEFSSASAASGKPLHVDTSGADDREGSLGPEVVAGCRHWAPN